MECAPLILGDCVELWEGCPSCEDDNGRGDKRFWASRRGCVVVGRIGEYTVATRVSVPPSFVPSGEPVQHLAKVVGVAGILASALSQEYGSGIDFVLPSSLGTYPKVT